MLSSVKMAGTVAWYCTTSSASRSRSASSSGVRPGPAGPVVGGAAPAVGGGAPPRVGAAGPEPRFHKRHDLISIPSKREPNPPVCLEPGPPRERAQEDARGVDLHAPDLAPWANPHHSPGPDLHALRRQTIARRKQERSERGQNESGRGDRQNSIARALPNQRPENDGRGQKEHRRKRPLARGPNAARELVGSGAPPPLTPCQPRPRGRAR